MRDAAGRYKVSLYYHGRVEQQFMGNELNSLLTKLHVCVDHFAAGSEGVITDQEHGKIVYICKYAATE